MNRPVKITGAGTAMLLMLFFILCLTVLCALGLLSASADLRLARTYAASVQTYYQADEQASRVLRALLQAELETLPETIAGTRYPSRRKTGTISRGICAPQVKIRRCTPRSFWMARGITAPKHGGLKAPLSTPWTSISTCGGARVHPSRDKHNAPR